MKGFGCGKSWGHKKGGCQKNNIYADVLLNVQRFIISHNEKENIQETET